MENKYKAPTDMEIELDKIACTIDKICHTSRVQINGDMDDVLSYSNNLLEANDSLQKKFAFCYADIKERGQFQCPKFHRKYDSIPEDNHCPWCGRRIYISSDWNSNPIF